MMTRGIEEYGYAVDCQHRWDTFGTNVIVHFGACSYPAVGCVARL